MRSMKSSWPERRFARRTVASGDRQEDDLVEVDVGLVPVVRILLEHDAVLRHALDEPERARAHRLGAELVALGLRRLGRDHHARAIRKRREQGRERGVEIQPHRVVVDHVHRRDGRELAPTVRARHGLVPLDVVLDRGGIELLAVVKRDALPELHDQRLVVRRPLPRRRELRHDVELLVDVDQLVAQGREHDAPDERARKRGIEDVRVLGEAEAQRLRAGD